MTLVVYVNHSVEGRSRSSNRVWACGQPGGVHRTRKVVQALREQSGMSTPIRAPLWIQAVATTSSPSRSTSSTGVSHSGHDRPSRGAAKQIAVWAATLADEAFAAVAHS